MEGKLRIYLKDWLKIRVEFKTEKEALEAVKNNGDALRYVKDQTEAVCMEAVKNNGNALQYVNSSFFEGE